MTSQEWVSTHWRFLLVALCFFAIWPMSAIIIKTGPLLVSISKSISILSFGAYTYFSFVRPHPALRWVAFVYVILALVFFPLIQMASMNNDSHISDVSPAIKAATQFMLQGKNPYVETYKGTVLDESVEINTSFWNRMDSDYLALIHFVYMPGLFLITVPFEAFFPTLSYVWILILIVIALFLLLAAHFKGEREVFIAGTLMNPLLIYSFSTINISDYLIIFLAAAVAITFRKDERISGILLGLLFAIKTYVFILFPFLLYYIWKTQKWKWASYAIVTWILVNGPFIVWNSHAYLDDLFITFVAPGSNNLTIWSDFAGFMPLIVNLGLITRDMVTISIPFILGAFLIGFYYFTLKKNITVGHAFLYGGATSFLVLFFSKHMPDNYLTFPFALFLAYFIFQYDNSSPATSPQN